MDFRLGKGFEIGNKAQITPYFGIGTPFWDRDLTGQGGPADNYGHGYAGGGLLVQYSPFHQWVLSAYGLAGGMFGSHLSAQSVPLPPDSFDFTLGNDTIYTAGLG